MTELGDLLGAGSIARQFFFWGVAYEAIRNLMAPFFQAELNKINAAHQEVPLSPADLADMTLRSVIGKDYGTEEAKKSGISPELFDLMVKNVGEPPGIQELIMLLRRGVLGLAGTGPDAVTLEQAVHESRVKDKYVPTIAAARWVPLSFAEVIDALVENQIDEDTAKRIAYWNGVASDAYNQQTVEQLPGAPTDPAGTLDQFTIARNTRGRPVSPGEAGELVNRGVIPLKGRGPEALSFEQAIYESAVKDKWEGPLEALIVRYPSAYYVVEMLKAGALDHDTAVEVFKAEGYSPSMVTALLGWNSSAKVAGSKALAQSIIVSMYHDQTIDNTTATGYLEQLGYSAQDAGFVLAVADLQREYTAVTSAISKVKAQYIAAKIDRPTALNALNALHVPADQVSSLLNIWDDELAVNVKVLTESQVVDAWFLQIIDQPTAMAELENIGYAPLDAWILLSIKNKAPLGSPPA